MALTTKSLFLYGFEVTATNRSLDFRAVMAGPILQATLRLGFYSLTGILVETARAMKEVDPTRIYTVSSDRTFSGGTQNRTTILTNGSYLDLLFLSGPRTASTVAPLLGYTVTDKTGALFYQGTLTAGTSLVPDFWAYTFLPPEMKRKVFGARNISASGEKETVVWNIQKFWQCSFKYETQANVKTYWRPLIDWMIQQRPLEFTPEVGSPSVFYEGTLESTAQDGNGMAMDMKEQLPNFPFLYETGMLVFRQKQS